VRESTDKTLYTSFRRRVRSTLRAIALAGTLLALTATSATAMPISPNEPSFGDRSPAPTIVRVIAPSSGFDWVDAGIGAGAGLGISLVALGGTLAAFRPAERHRRVVGDQTRSAARS
jgi:hypothetical protein